MTTSWIALVTACGLALTGCASSSADGSLTISSGSAAASAGDVRYANPEAPDALKFMAADLVTGEVIDGTSLMYKDVALWFWASWCPVCAAESGAIVAASKDFPEGVRIVGVAGRSDVPASKEFIAEHGIDGFANIYDEDGSIWKDFKVAGQPTLVLVNQDGQMRKYSGGYGKFDLIEKVAWLGES